MKESELLIGNIVFVVCGEDIGHEYQIVKGMNDLLRVGVFKG